MIKKISLIVILCILIFPVSIYVSAMQNTVSAEGTKKAKEYFGKKVLTSEPVKKKDGTKFQIGYIDIDPYPASGEMLYYFIEELKNRGWITYEEPLPFDPKDTDAKEMIKYLSELDLGDYIQFRNDANYYIAVDDEKEYKASLKEHVKKKDLDMIFCLGTSPGTLAIKELNIKDIPIMVYFSVDPVGAGLAKTEEYSGQDNVWCHTSFDVYHNQMKFYYDNYPFTNIGMVYYSETVAAMKAYRQAADQLGFKTTEKMIDTLSDAKDEKKVKSYYDTLKKSYQELIDEGIDAFMLNTDMIKDEDRIYELLEPFYEKNIPVFVQNGEYYVRKGALMVVTTSDAVVQAPFAAEAFSRILNGEDPGSISQKFVTPPYLSLNLKIAKRLGYHVPEEMIISAEKLYAD